MNPRSRSSLTRTVTMASAVLCAAGLLAACTSSSKKVAATPTPTTSASTTSTPTPSPTMTKPKPKPPATNALTGVGAPSTNPVVAVKIDDTAPGRPQRGIDKADVVYIEQVEGGLTRLLGVFSTTLPVVGYVRSTRPSDPELLLQYGKITLAASGGGGDSLPLLDASGIKPWINDRSAAFYSRVTRQSDYINLILDLGQVAKAAGTAAAKSNGWTFAAHPAVLAKSKPAGDVQTQVGSTAVEFRWSAALGKYVRYIEGVAQVADDGAPVAASNVIVQEVVVVPHPQDVDVNGNPSQYSHSVGTGRVWVMRNGRMIAGTWKRATVGSGTTLVDATGAPIPLSPGNTWVALKGTGLPITVS